MPPVQIYSTPGCQACRITASQFTALGVPFQMVALAENPERAADFAEHGYTAAPVVMVPDDAAYGNAAGTHWSGLRPDLIGSIPVAA